MSDFSQLVAAAERRARRMSGLRTAGSVLLLGEGLLLLGVLALRLLRIEIPSDAWSPIAAVACAVAAWIGYAFGRRKIPALPALLLRLDFALDLDARLSSLHELRLRGDRSPYRRRLEALLDLSAFDWRKGIPTPRFGVTALASGVGCLGVVVFLSFHPLPPPLSETPAVDSTATSSRGSSQDQTDLGAPIESLPGIPPTMEAEDAIPQTEPASDATDAQPFRLDDVLSELSRLDSSDPVLGDAPTDELDRLLYERREEAAALGEMLESILERIRHEGGGLTEDERQSLREQAGQMGSPQAVEALMDLLEENDPEVVEDMIESMLSTLDQDDTPPDGEPDTGGGSQSMGPSDEEGSESEDSLTDIDPGEPTEGDTGEVGPAGSESDPSGGTDPGLVQTDEDSRQPYGGEGGAPAMEGDPDEEREAGFIREEAPATLGASGDVSPFITEGVPIEIPSSDSAPASYVVDYTRMQSILRARDMPDDAVDTVRQYFETITRGGP